MKLNTHTNLFLEDMKQYFNERIDFDGYENDYCDLHNKYKTVYDIFKSEYDHEIKKQGNEQKAFCNWLQGLPSCFNIDFEYSKIINVSKRLGSLNENSSDKEIDNIIENWFNFCSVKFFQIKKKIESGHMTNY